jgi:hypothetical protein
LLAELNDRSWRLRDLIQLVVVSELFRSK